MTQEIPGLRRLRSGKPNPVNSGPSGKGKQLVRLAARQKAFDTLRTGPGFNEKQKKTHNRPGSTQKGRCR